MIKIGKPWGVTGHSYSAVGCSIYSGFANLSLVYLFVGHGFKMIRLLFIIRHKKQKK